MYQCNDREIKKNMCECVPLAVSGLHGILPATLSSRKGDIFYRLSEQCHRK